MRKFALIIILSLLSIGAYADELATLLESQIRSRLKENNCDIEVAISSNSKKNSLIGKELVDIEILDFNPQYRSFKARVYSKNEEGSLAESIVTGRYVNYVHVPVAKRVISQGEVISREDLIDYKIRASLVREDYVVDAASLEGKMAQSSLQIGKPIKSKDLRSVPVLNNKDSVIIAYNSHNIQLKTTGIAMQSGAIGDRIKVRNERSGVEIFARVKSKNMVVVGYD